MYCLRHDLDVVQYLTDVFIKQIILAFIENALKRVACLLEINVHRKLIQT